MRKNVLNFCMFRFLELEKRDEDAGRSNNKYIVADLSCFRNKKIKGPPQCLDQENCENGSRFYLAVLPRVFFAVFAV